MALLVCLAASRSGRAEVLALAEVEARAASAGGSLASKAKTAGADADLEAAHSGRRPVVSFNGDASLSPGGQLIDLTTPDGQHYLVQGSRGIGESGAFATVPRYGGVVALQTNLCDFGRTSSRIRAAEHRARASRSDEESLRAEAVRAARDAYLAWTVAYARVAAAEARRRVTQAQTERLRGSIADGTRPRADEGVVDQEELAVDFEVAEARGELERTHLALEQLVGGAWTTATIPDLEVLENPTAEGSDQTQLDSEALEQQAAAAETLAESLARAHAPLIAASGEVGARGQASSVFPVYRVALTLTVPLWDGGLGAAQARATQAQADQLRAEAGAVLKARRDEQELARRELLSARERVRLAERLSGLARDEVEHAMERYRLGAADLGALFQAREQLARAEERELTAKADRARAALHARP
jgi:outer membrane protein TolC